MHLPPPQAAALGAALGLAIALFTVGAEAWLQGVGWATLHTTSVTVWVVESLPLMLGVAGYGVADRHRPITQRAPAPNVGAQRPDVPPAAVPPPAPTYPTPAPAPRTPTAKPPPPRRASLAPPEPVMLPTSLEGQALLYVDRHAESPAVVSALEDAGLRVVHVRDAMSGAVAWEAEAPTLAAVDASDPNASALVRELRSDGVVLVEFGPGTNLPRPLRPQVLVDALAQVI